MRMYGPESTWTHLHHGSLTIPGMERDVQRQNAQHPGPLKLPQYADYPLDALQAMHADLQFFWVNLREDDTEEAQVVLAHMATDLESRGCQVRAEGVQACNLARALSQLEGMGRGRRTRRKPDLAVRVPEGVHEPDGVGIPRDANQVRARDEVQVLQVREEAEEDALWELRIDDGP